ncbi:MAG TPA: phosphoribosyl-AMP cyclohydrolase [Propylenella sp.]
MPPTKDSASAGIEESGRFTPRFGPDGLIPCVTIEASSGDVLMFAWMNEEALRRTLETGLVHYWSRSRRTIWVKGESSGAHQRVVELRTDCDQDVVLVRAEVSHRAGTCHTGRTTCFYRSVPLGPGPVERPFRSGEGEIG